MKYFSITSSNSFQKHELFNFTITKKNPPHAASIPCQIAQKNVIESFLLSIVLFNTQREKKIATRHFHCTTNSFTSNQLCFHQHNALRTSDSKSENFPLHFAFFSLRFVREIFSKTIFIFLPTHDKEHTKTQISRFFFLLHERFFISWRRSRLGGEKKSFSSESRNFHRIFIFS